MPSTTTNTATPCIYLCLLLGRPQLAFQPQLAAPPQKLSQLHQTTRSFPSCHLLPFSVFSYSVCGPILPRQTQLLAVFSMMSPMFPRAELALHWCCHPSDSHAL